MTGPLAAGDATVSTSRARIVIADDDVLLREGLASLLERSGLEVVGQAGDGDRLLDPGPRAPSRSRHRRHPDAADEHHGGSRGRAADPRGIAEIAICVLSAHVELEEATELLASGQRTGYLLKSRITDVDEFVDTLGRILKGAAIVDPGLVKELFAARRVHDPLDDLSPREREVLALMAEGRSNAGIGRQVGDRGHGREARPQHPDEARCVGDHGRPPSRARGAVVPRRALILAAANATGWPVTG